MSTISVLIVDDIANTREDIKRLLHFEEDIQVIGEAADGESAYQLAEELRPDVILMDINLPRMDGITSSEKISLDVPESAIIIISIQGEQEYMRKAMAAGAKEYLVKPFSSSELSDSIRKVNATNQKRRLYLLPGKEVPTKSFIPKRGKAITFFSTKGGMGKTTIACNLAVSLAQSTQKRVALLDMALTAGDVAVMLNISVNSTIADLVQEQDNMDFSLVDSFMIPHLTGVRILPAPTGPEQAELIHTDHIEQLISILKQNFDYIIIDTAPTYSEINLALMENSDHILVLLTQELPALKHAKTAMDIFGTLNYTAKVQLLLNKANREDGIKISDLEQSLNIPMTAIIPDEQKTVRQSINKGLPFVMTQPSSRITQAFNELREILQPTGKTLTDSTEISVPAKKSFIGKLFTF